MNRTMAELMALPAGDGPKVITTQERDAVEPGTVVRDAQGTIACRHPSGVGVVFGDERPFPWDYPVAARFSSSCARSSARPRHAVSRRAPSRWQGGDT